MKRRAILLGLNFVLVAILAIFTGTQVSAHRANKLPSVPRHQQSQSMGKQPPPEPINLAYNKPATASSTEDARYHPYDAVDGKLTTRWSSVVGGNGTEWLQIDLQNLYFINKVSLYWERAYATSYQIQDSPDQITWTRIYSTTTGAGGNEVQTGLTGLARYVRIYATHYAPARKNFSLWEVEVYGDAAGPQGAPGVQGLPGIQGTPGPIGPRGPLATPQYGYIANTSAQTVPIGGNVTFNYSSTTSGISLSGLSTITVNITGVYRFVFSVSGTAPDQFVLSLNGVPVNQMENFGSQPSSGRGILSLTAGDTLTLTNTSTVATVALLTPNGTTQTNASILIERLGDDIS